ncbi:hypothetical protein BJ684DRAFT_20834 [Piptocephalis cylindrospora]|uniref:Calponin-homology (CH) domain-containing protein n=1 Tax=Piptocephalis cylindrospora TaxID=1907219 RepID=A0A4V1IXY1_9FUNG|nr:hypothetical protein BJ684DRAFT_20834 [Piptocephalis cylindrospora]|eukprot:RKP12639.1 hypothetical protein BJ684DRAFT_20834 [Piptocephalis cylindrospora]
MAAIEKVYRIYQQEHPNWRPCITKDILDRLVFILQYYSPEFLHVGVMVLVKGSERKEVKDSASPSTWISLLIDPEGLLLQDKARDIDYREAIIQVLGLVKLLDLSMEAGLFPPGRSLIQPESEMTSSTGILQEIVPILFTRGSRWAGVLQTHGYSLHYTQSSLDGVCLSVEDLGKDLQDGVGLLALIRLGSHQAKLEIDQIKPSSIGGLPKGSVLLGEVATLKTPDIPSTQDRLPLYFRNEMISLLLRWCQCVVAASRSEDEEGRRPIVPNFTMSFADGSVLCLLIAHYRPDLIDARRVIIGEEGGRKRSKVEVESREGSVGPGEPSWFVDLAKAQDSSPVHVAWRRNVNLLSRAIPHLPGMPMLLNEEFHPIPDDRSIILIVSHLSRSLLIMEKNGNRPNSPLPLKPLRTARSQVKLAQKATRVIERAWREYRDRKKILDRISRMAQMFRRFDGAARTIQSHWRSRVQGLQQQQRFQDLRRTVSLMQAVWKRSRAFKRRVEAERGELRARRAQKARLILVQAQCRGWLGRHRIAQERGAALRIQRAWRGWRVRRDLARWKSAAIQIQRVWRGWRVRRDLEKQENAARQIQRVWKGMRDRRGYRARLSQIIRCQAIARGWVVRYALGVAWDAAVRIQGAWRWYCLEERCRYRRWVKEEKAATIIQATYRGRMVRLAYKEHLMLREEAARVIQAAWRGYQAVRIVEERWMAKCEGEALRYSLYQLNSAALKIQRQWRARQVGRWVRTGYQGLLESTVKIQAAFRGWAARKAYWEMHDATLILQRQWRARAEGIWVREAYQELREATILLQAYTRGWIVRQRVWDAHFAAQAIQAAFRGWRTRRYLQELEGATLILQQLWRARARGRWVQGAYAELRGATVCIQAHVRGWRVRRRVKEAHDAAQIIQTTYRRWRIQHMYQELHQATLTLQRAWRGRKVIQEHLREWRDVQVATGVIQRWWRSRMLCRILAWRISIRRQVRLEEEASVRIQAIWKGWRQRKHYHRIRRAATNISLWYRHKRDRRRYDRLRQATLLIQRARRIQLAERRRERERAAWIIQRWWRVAHGQYEDRVKEEEAVRRIQAAWKGYRVRMETSRRVGEALARIRQVTEGAKEEMRLGNRTSTALRILLGGSRMSDILGACVHLEVVTRLSRECRLQLLHHQAIEVLYEVLSGCNRSMPHQAVMRHGLASLYHLSLDDVTAPYVLGSPSSHVHLGMEGGGKVKGVDVLLELLQRYREALDVLGKISLILHQLVVTRGLIQPLRRTPNAVRRLRSIIHLVSRQVAMDERSHRALTQVQARALQERRVIIGHLSAVASAGERKRI